MPRAKTTATKTKRTTKTKKTKEISKISLPVEETTSEQATKVAVQSVPIESIKVEDTVTEITTPVEVIDETPIVAYSHISLDSPTEHIIDTVHTKMGQIKKVLAKNIDIQATLSNMTRVEFTDNTQGYIADKDAELFNDLYKG